MDTATIQVQGLTITLAVSLPQLDTLTTQVVQAMQQLGDRIVDSLDPIRLAVANLQTTLIAAIDTELGQIAAALEEAQHPAQVQALVADIDAARDRLKERVAAMMPDIPPAPTPTPEPPPLPTPEPAPVEPPA